MFNVGCVNHKRNHVETLINRPDFEDAVKGSATWVRASLETVARLSAELEARD